MSKLPSKNQETAILSYVIVVLTGVGLLFAGLQKTTAIQAPIGQKKEPIAFLSKFAGAWGDSSANGEYAFFLFIEQNGASLKGWYFSQNIVDSHAKTLSSLDPDKPGLVGTVEGDKAKLTVHNPNGSVTEANLELIEERAHWSSEEATSQLPHNESLFLNFEPSNGFWAKTLR